MLRPIIVCPCGARVSRSQTGATGYHWSSQSNYCSFAGISSSAHGSGVSPATADIDIDSRRALHAPHTYEAM
ncbi:hypothetical protein E2562_018913 [Oryza meyeriana var. granulata]|uniref:Uncharacterized protein n=1 Tax=Oryza meyeriana var. granulata TaxID=110450 RepID=A0A6G1DKB1_9ORYZ|nr:hypothetical protein E2562_018913 [Oryza meyeriana var. granulata]